MSNTSALTISYLEKQPLSAARALSDMETDDAAAFLQSIPTRYSAGTIAYMDVWSASIIIAKMDVSSAAAVLQALDYQMASAIFRMLDEEIRSPIIELLPFRLRRDLETFLSYPEDTVGANMTTAAVTLTGNQTVADALELLKRSHKAKSEVAFVLDSEKVLIGAATAAELLRESSSKTLVDVMDTNIVPLSARARLTTIALLDAWDDYPQLPVLSRKKLIVGVLSRKAAKQNRARNLLGHGTSSTSIAMAIASAFVTSALGLGQLLAEMDQPRQHAKRKGDPS